MPREGAGVLNIAGGGGSLLGAAVVVARATGSDITVGPTFGILLGVGSPKASVMRMMLS